MPLPRATATLHEVPTGLLVLEPARFPKQQAEANRLSAHRERHQGSPVTPGLALKTR